MYRKEQLTCIENLPYKDRLKVCDMSTLHYRRIRGDMIETYDTFWEIWYQI